MPKLVKQSSNIRGKTKTYFDKRQNAFIKHHHWFDKKYFSNHPKLMKKYYPGILINQTTDRYTMKFVYKKIAGVVANKVVEDNTMMTKMYRDILDELDRTWPYYHNDWSNANILFSKGKFYLIDWTSLEQGHTKSECIEKINRDLREGFDLWKSWTSTDDAIKIMKGYNYEL